MTWKPKFIQLPIDKMAGAPWNLLDYRGFRIAWCGTDGNHEKDGELIANDLLNLIAIGEASGELLDAAAKKLAALPSPDPGQTPCPTCESQAQRVEFLEAALREACRGITRREYPGGIRLGRKTWWEDETPNLAKWLKEAPNAS